MSGPRASTKRLLGTALAVGLTLAAAAVTDGRAAAQEEPGGATIERHDAALDSVLSLRTLTGRWRVDPYVGLHLSDDVRDDGSDETLDTTREMFGVFPTSGERFLLLAHDGRWLRLTPTGRITADASDRSVAVELRRTGIDGDECLEVYEGGTRVGFVSSSLSGAEVRVGDNCGFREGHLVDVRASAEVVAPIFTSFFVPVDETSAAAPTDVGDVRTYFNEWRDQQSQIGTDLRLRLGNQIGQLLTLEFETVRPLGVDEILGRIATAAAGEIDGAGALIDLFQLGLELATLEAGIDPDVTNEVKLTIALLDDEIEQRYREIDQLIRRLEGEIVSDPRRLGRWDSEAANELFTADSAAARTAVVDAGEVALWQELLPRRTVLHRLENDSQASCWRGSPQRSAGHFYRWASSGDRPPGSLMFVSVEDTSCVFNSSVDYESIGIGFRNDDGNVTPVETAILQRLFGRLDIDVRTVMCSWLRDTDGDARPRCDLAGLAGDRYNRVAFRPHDSLRLLYREELLAPAAAPECGGLSSTQGDQQLQRFTNTTRVPVNVSWVDWRGRAHQWLRLAPGESVELGSFIGHAWIAHDDGGRCLSAHTVGDGPMVISACNPGHRSSSTGSFVSNGFVNLTDRDVHLQWLDWEGEPIDYAVIRPDQGIHIGTFAGHVWQAIDETGCLGTWAVRSGDDVIID